MCLSILESVQELLLEIAVNPIEYVGVNDIKLYSLNLLVSFFLFIFNIWVPLLRKVTRSVAVGFVSRITHLIPIITREVLYHRSSPPSVLSSCLDRGTLPFGMKIW
jgi:hypothetical protein